MNFSMLEGRDPTPGMFFLQDKSPETCENIIWGNQVATGMAFMVREDGLLVTCAHVIAALDLLPGDRVYVHSAYIPVSAEAIVLPEKWIGPGVNAEGYVRDAFYPQHANRSLDAYKEDIALLRLTGKADWHRGGDYGVGHAPDTLVRATEFQLAAQDPLHSLLEYARALPLAAPTYSTREKNVLNAWLTEWCAIRFEPKLGDAEFIRCEDGRNQYHAVLLRSKAIRPGFSGSPLWDDNRQRVVGMVRCTLEPAMPEHARATDARFIARHAEVALRVDSQLENYLHILRECTDAASSSIFLINPSDAGQVFVEPALAPQRFNDPLQRKTPVAGKPASQLFPGILKTSKVALLVGQAGAGKTTLLYRVAKWCTDNEWHIGGRIVVPVIVRAHDLTGSDFSFSAMLGKLRLTHGVDFDELAMLRALERNNAALLLLVDGLDETRPEQQKLVLQRLCALAGMRTSRGVEASSVVENVLVATRPLSAEQLDENGYTRFGIPVYEIQLLTYGQVNQLAAAFFSEEGECKRFLEALQDMGWYEEEPTPLQIRMAVEVFMKTGSLPQHVWSLTQKMINIRVAACSSAKSLHGIGPSEYLDVYCRKCEWLLQFLASCHVDGTDVTLDTIRDNLVKLQVESRAPRWLRDASGFLAFIQQEGARQTGLYWFMSGQGKESPILVWYHSTIRDLLLARWHCAHLERKQNIILAWFRSQTKDVVQLNLLSIFEQEKDYDLVKLVLQDWLASATVSSSEVRKLLIALSTGIDAGGELRPLLIRELLRITLMDFDRSYLCRELYAASALPSLLKLAKRPHVMQDIIDGFTWRFQMRRKRLSTAEGMPAVLMSEREARLIDALGLWESLSVKFTLIDPRPTQEADEARKMIASVGGTDTAIPPPGNDTTVMLRNANRVVQTLNMDSPLFVERLCLAARELPGIPAMDLVALISQITLEVGHGRQVQRARDRR